jgi:cell division protease FtsH
MKINFLFLVLVNYTRAFFTRPYICRHVTKVSLKNNHLEGNEYYLELHNANNNETTSDSNSNKNSLIFILSNKNNTGKYGYPQQANMNISYPPIDDIESEESLRKYKQRLMGDNGLTNKNYGFSNSSQSYKRTIRGIHEKEDIVDFDDDDDDDEKPERDLEYEKKIQEDFEKEMQNALGVRFFIRKNDNNNNENSKTQSENFEIIQNPTYSFNDVGGYENVKLELMQSVDMLKNFEKYQKYNVRTPKGMILEGPPGNGKTLMARAFSGEVNSSFIPVSGSQFQEKYVGVGASRIRELFELAENNLPCVIFIDEIDAVGRSRSSDDGSSSGERDQTLNQLLVALDGYKNTSGIFVIGATNRVDLLDEALIRPGRIDKKIYIGNPDVKTREKILNIHIQGKPYELDVRIPTLIDMTNGLSGAQIENLLNEAMLYALRENREKMNNKDLEHILGRMLVGYQPNENAFSENMIYRISIHEMGHAIVGLLSNDHSKLVKVCLNLWSPSSPGYTIFEQPETDSYIYTKERLMARLMVLLGGRIAEEVFFGASITSGASKDIEEAYSLAERMIVKFGMGKKTVYPYNSENSKEFIDRDIERLLESAYQASHQAIVNSQPIMEECANMLMKNKLLLPDDILKVIQLHHIQNSNEK